MILGAEVALFLVGLYALITGKLPTGAKSKHVVRGWPARAIGAIGLLPVPLSFVLAMAVAILFAVQGRDLRDRSLVWVGMAIEVAVVVTCVVFMAVLVRIYRTPVEQVPAVRQPS
jgi:hypothetical protein